MLTTEKIHVLYSPNATFHIIPTHEIHVSHHLLVSQGKIDIHKTTLLTRATRPVALADDTSLPSCACRSLSNFHELRRKHRDILAVPEV
jgi:hypothetical protein